MLQMGGMPIEVGFPFFNKRSFSNSYHTRCDLQGINPTFKDSGFLSASVFRISCRQHHLCRGLVFSSVFEADWPADETRDHYAESQSALLFKFTSSWCNRFYADWRTFFTTAPWSNSSKPSSSWCRGSRGEWRTPSPSWAQISIAKTHKNVGKFRKSHQLENMICQVREGVQIFPAHLLMMYSSIVNKLCNIIIYAIGFQKLPRRKETINSIQQVTGHRSQALICWNVTCHASKLKSRKNSWLMKMT